jgi:OTU-like cysteine protease
MKINANLGRNIIDVLDCLPVISTISNLAIGLFCLFTGTRHEKPLAERVLVAVPVVGNIYKICILAKRGLQSPVNEDKHPLIAKASTGSIQLNPQAINFSLVKPPKDLADFVGKNTPQRGGFEFSVDGETGQEILRRRHEIPGLCDRVVVKGDGHCLFRSTAYYLLSNARHDPAIKTHFKTSLDSFLASVRAQGINKFQFEDAARLIKAAIDSDVDPLVFLNDAPHSDALVKALRQLSCCHTHMQAIAPHNDRFSLLLLENLTDADQLNLPEYMNQMTEVHADTPGKFGSGLEIDALSNIFRLNTLVFNFAPYMAPLQVYKPQGAASMLFMCLYFRQAHYDSMMVSKAHIETLLD